MPNLPPPLLPLLFFIIGVALHLTIWRVQPLPQIWNLAIGIIIVLCAIAIAVSSFRSFKRRGESLAIHIPTQNLVSHGIYKISRNPVYLSFILVAIGLGCIINSLAVILSVIASFAALNWYTISKEERYLRRKLGEEYEDYCRRVRRWL